MRREALIAIMVTLAAGLAPSPVNAASSEETILPQVKPVPPPQKPRSVKPPQPPRGYAPVYGFNPPAIIPLPSPPSSNDATAAFKRDLLQPRVDDLRSRDALGQLDPTGQRDLLNRQQELYRLETDPLRR